MADLNRGKTIFENRVEYPLPKKPGVRDYVFYFVPASDGYGRGARAFFDKFYPNHVKKDAGSLEALIATLHAEVTQHGVQQIREITIVSHGNEQGLNRPVLNGVTAMHLQEFKYLTLSPSPSCRRTSAREIPGVPRATQGGAGASAQRVLGDYQGL